MLLTIIIFIIIIGLLVFVHEFGHFISAKKSGVAVEEFGFGFPPRLFGIKRKETIYSINAIPLGGFVKIKGEEGGTTDSDSFIAKSFWKKCLILASGVGMNVAFAFIIITIGLMIGLPMMVEDGQALPKNARDYHIQIAQVYGSSAAAAAGLKAGDTINSIDTKTFTKIEEMQQYIKDNQNNSLKLEIKRGDEIITKEIQPTVITSEGPAKILGVMLVGTAFVSYSLLPALYHGFLTTFSVLWQIIAALFLLLKNLFSGVNVGDQFAGPVGVAVLTGQVAKLGFIYILQFTAVLSLNLAIINILPLPALDGGRILFLVIEKIRGKANNEKVENIVHRIGFTLLITLVIFITYKDILKYGHSILNAFKNIF
jgi:regulator of sigma E protease